MSESRHVDGARPLWVLMGRFLVVHILMVSAYLLIAFGADRLIFGGQPSFYPIGPGERFRTLDEATEAIARESEERWPVIWGIPAPLPLAVNLLTWLRRREFALFWVIMSPIPIIGPLFFALPGSWILANGPFRGPARPNPHA